jgi:cytochrome c peroxidase
MAEMTRRLFRMPIHRLVLVAACAAWGSSTAMAGDGEPRRPRLQSLAELPPEEAAAEATIALGNQLFFDLRLSGGNDVRCATCHAPAQAWADGRAGSPAVGGGTLARNAPTVLNLAWQERLLWDGRVASLEEQALLPIQHPEEMNQSLDDLEVELNAVPGYVERFEAAFGTAVTRQGIATALAAFQRTLRSGSSPLDRYLAGDKQALSPLARQGMELFTGDADCIRCHHGPLLADGEFYRLGVGFRDEGRGAVTGDAGDRYKFRTPPLRDVARTAPYMHDGSLATLTEVVEFYYREAPTQGPEGLPLDVRPLLGKSFSEIPALVAFLEALSGEPIEVGEPELPR